jgi:hypothetical protein
MPPADKAHIGYSKLKLVRALIVGIGAMAGNLAMAFQWPGEIDHGRFLEFIGYFGAIFCGLILYFSLRRLFDNRVIVAITPEGLMDLRVVKSPIPWRAIRTVSLWGFTRAKFIVVTLDPEVEKGLVLSPADAPSKPRVGRQWDLHRHVSPCDQSRSAPLRNPRPCRRRASGGPRTPSQRGLGGGPRIAACVAMPLS